ncbi:MAG: MFS transporter, partial [Thermomicrobiaceae bacterium]|nr:MFS transporter [Thermomicrobiaceae bacterium]
IGFYNTLWPLYIEALHATPPEIGLVIGLMGMIRLLFLLPSGHAAERVPLRRLIVGARALASVGLLLLAAAQQWWQLFPGIVLLGAANVAWPAVSSVIVENAGSAEERTRAFTLIYTVGPSLATVLTPALGGIVADVAGLRAIFLGAALLNALAVVFFSRIAPRPALHHDGPPVTYRAALAHRPILLVSGLQFVTIFVVTLGVTLVPNYLREVHGVEIGRIGWLGSVSAAGSVVLGIVISRARPFRRPLAGLALAVASVAGMLATLLVSGAFWLYALAYLLRGGYLVAWSAFYPALGEVTPDRLRGRAYALAELQAGAGYSLAPFAAGWLYDIHPAAPLATSLALIGPVLLGTAWVARAVGSREVGPAVAREVA